MTAHMKKGSGTIYVNISLNDFWLRTKDSKKAQAVMQDGFYPLAFSFKGEVYVVNNPSVKVIPVVFGTDKSVEVNDLHVDDLAREINLVCTDHKLVVLEFVQSKYSAFDVMYLASRIKNEYAAKIDFWGLKIYPEQNLPKMFRDTLAEIYQEGF